MSGADSSMLPMASGLHNCFVIANRERHGAFLLLTIIPLGTDEEGELLLNLPKAFQREDAELLDQDGSCSGTGWRRPGNGCAIPAQCIAWSRCTCGYRQSIPRKAPGTTPE